MYTQLLTGESVGICILCTPGFKSAPRKLETAHAMDRSAIDVY
jgi:hypothetical protein